MIEALLEGAAREGPHHDTGVGGGSNEKSRGAACLKAGPSYPELEAGRSCMCFNFLFLLVCFDELVNEDIQNAVLSSLQICVTNFS